jgi:hypothetical protein
MIADIQPGIFDFDAATYHADPCPYPSLSSSVANILLTQSPAHAWLAHPRLNPAFTVTRETDSRLDLGSIAHAMLLEPHTDPIVIVDAADWRTKAAKEQRDAAHAAGKFAILAHKYADVQAMVIAARAYIDTTELAGIFETGDAERTIIWQEGETWCRARPDLLSADRRIIVDYKTTDSAAPDAFSKQIGRMGYDLQSEFYSRGMFAITGREDAAFVFLVQEITRPYACSLISLSNAYREVGQLKVKRALSIWDKCTHQHSWPGYDTRILYCEPKPWDLIDAESTESTQEEST